MTGVVLVNNVAVSGDLIYTPLRISHGRSGVNSQPDAPALEMETFGPDPICQPGDKVEVAAGPGAATRGRWGDPNWLWNSPEITWDGSSAEGGTTTRFVGYVVAMEAEEQFGDVVGWRVRCLGGQAALGRLSVQVQRPAETDVDRVLALAADAGVDITILGEPSLVLAADSADRSFLSAIYEVTQSTGGLFWQGKDGELFYGTANHRRGVAESTIPAKSILDGLNWETDVDGVINHLTVKRPDGNGGETQETFSDQESIDKWGQRHAEASTLVENADEAGLLALTVLARRSDAYWRMPGMMVPMDDLTPVEAAVIDALEMSDGLLAPLPDEPGPTPAPAQQWAIEGWVEEFAEDGRWIQFSLSDWARSSSAILRTYQIVFDTLTYGQAAAKTYQKLIAEVA